MGHMRWGRVFLNLSGLKWNIWREIEKEILHRGKLGHMEVEVQY